MEEKDKDKVELILKSSRLRGSIEFRKMLDKLNKMSSDDEPYNTEFNEAIKEDNEEKRQVLMEQAFSHFKKDKKEYARKIADFWCENSVSWWD